ncbi:MAG: hypothetical protein V4629_04680 [Pseudomonadota bacterium]
MIPSQLDFSRQFTQDIDDNLIPTLPIPQTKQSLLSAVKVRAELAENLPESFFNAIDECIRNPDPRIDHSRLVEIVSIGPGLIESLKPSIRCAKEQANIQDLNNYLNTKIFFKRPFLKSRIESEVKAVDKTASRVQCSINFGNMIENLAKNLKNSEILREENRFMHQMDNCKKRFTSITQDTGQYIEYLNELTSMPNTDRKNYYDINGLAFKCFKNNTMGYYRVLKELKIEFDVTLDKLENFPAFRNEIKNLVVEFKSELETSLRIHEILQSNFLLNEIVNRP